VRETETVSKDQKGGETLWESTGAEGVGITGDGRSERYVMRSRSNFLFLSKVFLCDSGPSADQTSSRSGCGLG
jgi:hypothetical protein